MCQKENHLQNGLGELDRDKKRMRKRGREEERQKDRKIEGKIEEGGDIHAAGSGKNMG